MVWDTLAISEYLHEQFPAAGLLPADPADRAHCRSICGEMHSGFANLRAALPMNIKARHHDFQLWSGAQNDVERILTIWRNCLSRSGGPYLFGRKPTVRTPCTHRCAPVSSRTAWSCRLSQPSTSGISWSSPTWSSGSRPPRPSPTDRPSWTRTKRSSGRARHSCSLAR